MRFLPLFLLILLFACKNSQQVQQESAMTESLEIPTLADFRASGNEPGWMLEIEFAKSMRFKSFDMGTFEMLMPVPEAVREQDGELTIYTSVSDQGTLEVRIIRKPCMDAMSAKSFAYTVEVDAQTPAMKNPQKYSGCGLYMGDYRLNDIWSLREINGEKVKSDDFARNAPYLEFNLSEGRVLGAGGCNSFSGNFTTEENKITFGPLMSTKMACPQMAFENKFTGMLSDKTLEVMLQGLLLVLKEGENTLVFRKVD